MPHPVAPPCCPRRYAYLYATLCFFGGILITYAFDQALHCVEHFLTRRKGKSKSPTSISKDHQTPPEERTPPSASDELEMDVEDSHPARRPSETRADDSIDMDDAVGHDGHMVANIYENHGHDGKALIRMGIFAGIALAFHVSNCSSARCAFARCDWLSAHARVLMTFLFIFDLLLVAGPLFLSLFSLLARA